jgi:spermidine synthase
LWLRLLGLVFGVTTYAATTVLAAFMAGRAIGSIAGGRLADRTARPLFWFGVAEITVGIAAPATAPILALLQQIYANVAPNIGTIGSLTLLRFVCSFAVLLIPTTAMGATMPLAIKAARSPSDSMGETLSSLYAANTAGAVGGALLTGFVLIGRLGLSGSFRVAAAINTFAAVAAFAGSARQRTNAVADLTHRALTRRRS